MANYFGKSNWFSNIFLVDTDLTPNTYQTVNETPIRSDQSLFVGRTSRKRHNQMEDRVSPKPRYGFNNSRIFKNSLFKPIECKICFEAKSGYNFLSLDCGHKFCFDCMKKYFEANIALRTVNNLKCPQTDCDQLADQKMIKTVVSEKFFQRYERLLERKMKHNEEELSLDLIDKNYKRCPNCTTPIEKICGCEHMYCIACHEEFCWECLIVFSKGFCRCEQLSEDDYYAEEETLNPESVDAFNQTTTPPSLSTLHRSLNNFHQSNFNTYSQSTSVSTQTASTLTQPPVGHTVFPRTPLPSILVSSPVQPMDLFPWIPKERAID